MRWAMLTDTTGCFRESMPDGMARELGNGIDGQVVLRNRRPILS